MVPRIKLTSSGFVAHAFTHQDGSLTLDRSSLCLQRALLSRVWFYKVLKRTQALLHSHLPSLFRTRCNSNRWSKWANGLTFCGTLQRLHHQLTRPHSSSLHPLEPTPFHGREKSPVTAFQDVRNSVCFSRTQFHARTHILCPRSHESNARSLCGDLGLSLTPLARWEPAFLCSPHTRAQFMESGEKESSVYSDKPNRKWGWGVKGGRVFCC